ncbi:MAG TPA: MarR family transcriptional regulator [Kofleriaceae bacterium]|jgi:DNA-binding MarR family transcriptional regulator|nr:MarR family transcriptional regulator [Kofleriaceae bacterium]
MKDALRLDDQLCFALYAASRAVTAAYQPLLAPLGLTYPQYLVMLVLWEEDGPSIKHLGARLHLDSGTLTPLLKRLEAQGLVRRARDAGDERLVRIHLTPAGKKLERRAADVPRQLACRSGLSLAHIARLREELRQLTHTVRAADPVQEASP